MQIVSFLYNYSTKNYFYLAGNTTNIGKPLTFSL